MRTGKHGAEKEWRSSWLGSGAQCLDAESQKREAFRRHWRPKRTAVVRAPRE